MGYTTKFFRGMEIGVLLSGIGVMASFAPTPASAQSRYNGDSVSRQPNGNLEARIETDRTQYGSGRAVEITLSVTNIGQYEVAFMSPMRGLPYELSVRDGRSNRTVYTLDTKRGGNTNRGLRFAINEKKTWRELWDGRDDKGNRLPSGVYVVEARIAGQQTVSTQIFLNASGNRPDRPGPGDGDNGNGGGGNGNPDRPQWPGRPPIGGGSDSGLRSLRPQLTAARNLYRPGDTVRLTYVVKNTSPRPVQVQFSSGKRWDMRALDPSGRQLWQDSDNKRYMQALTEMTLRPDAENTFSSSWTIPQNARSGSYEIQAFLTPRGSSRSGIAVTTFRIQVVSGNGNQEDSEARPDWNNRYGGNRYDYTNRNNRVPQGTIGGTLGGPSILYGSRSGVTLVSARLITGPDNAQYIGKKVTVSGRYVPANPRTSNGDWQIGDNGALLTVSGKAPALPDGASVTVTGVVRQSPSGQVYLSVL